MERDYIGRGDIILKHYKYTDKEKAQLLKSIVILVDTRENKNQHILDWFDRKEVPYKKKALENGDYSFYIPKNVELNIERDLYFDKEIMIERKNSVDELAGNFTKNRTRFEEELATYSGKKYLLIENSDYTNIIKGNYRSEYASKSYLATLHTFNHRYNIEVVFMQQNQYSALWIYMTFLYWIRERIR